MLMPTCGCTLIAHRGDLGNREEAVAANRKPVCCEAGVWWCCHLGGTPAGVKRKEFYMKKAFYTLVVVFCVLCAARNLVAQNNDEANWDIKALDTARSVSYLSSVEKDVILELNMVRSNPRKYAELYIKPMQAWFGGPFGDKGYLAPGASVYTMTSEGAKGVESCVADLSNRPGGLPLFYPKEGMSHAAKDHVEDTGPSGITGHTGKDGSSLSQRVNRYGKWDGSVGENISYGGSTGRDIVIQLLIDDGVPSRGHRTNIMNKSFEFIGVAIGPHKQFRFMCVKDFANKYTP
jgi:hypothetical protein